MSNNNLHTEFRYNKKRKHYSYIYKRSGDIRHNLLLSTKPKRQIKKNGKKFFVDNVKLSKHPNPNSNKQVYLITKRYKDNKNNFDYALNSWKFSPNDRLKVKKIKNGKWK